MDPPKIQTIRQLTPTIPGYIIKKIIGVGGMATVYLAIQESLDRTVALKIVSPSVGTIDPQASERFLKEGKIIAHLNHPNIVTVYDIGKALSFHYMAMEYISGGSLSDRLKNDTAIQDPIEIIRQIANALGHAHKSDIIHRDVKPGNILFREDGSVILSDFGIAKALSSQTSLTSTGFLAGTPEYMSPEQARGDPVDNRTDLYSLGVVLFEILARKKPFKGEDPFGTAMSHISAPIPPLPEQFAYYQPIVDRLLAKDPDDRFMSAGQLIKALDRKKATSTQELEFIDQSSTQSVKPEAKTRIVERRRRPRKPIKTGIDLMGAIRWSVAIVAAIGVVAAGVYWFASPRIDPQTKWIVNLMLNNASRQISESKLIEPMGDNAFENYRNILELMPDNEHALNGLQIIADRFEAQAIEKQVQGLYEESISLLDKGLLVAPNNERLVRRKEEVTKLLDQIKLDDQLAELFLKAEAFIEASEHTETAEENALKVYRQILELSPDNRKALEGIQRIVKLYVNAAVFKQHNAQYEEGLELVLKGLQIDPKSNELRTLKQSILGKIEETKLKKELSQLHSLANQQLSNSKFIRPSGENAFETYQKILMLDAGNERAREGIKNVMQNVLEQVRKAQSQGDYDEALELVDRMLSLQPDDGDIMSLKTEIHGLLEKKRLEEKVLKLETLAERQVRELKMLSPSGDNAYETYMDIVELDPENARVRRGLADISNYYRESARRALEEGRTSNAFTDINNSLRVTPGDGGAVALRRQIISRLEEQKEREDTLKRLFAEVDEQVDKLRYVEPAGDNAFETFRVPDRGSVNPSPLGEG